MSDDTKKAPRARLKRLLEQKCVLLDGGSASELVRLGCHSINDDPLWSARLLKTNPDIVKQSYKNYLTAGSELLVTVSYQASVGGFIEHLGVDMDTAKYLIGRSVTLAREASTETGVDAVVAGSVGAYGAALHDGSEYSGTYAEQISKEEMKAWHRPRIEALLKAGADMLAVETIPVLKEAEAVVELLVEFPNARCWISFSCKDGEHTCHGERFCDAVQSVVQSDQVVAVGFNCTSPDHACGLLDTLQPLKLHKPILVKPNRGETWVPGTGWLNGSGSLQFKVKDWLDRGATWIGGCCRIYPDDIANMKTILNADTTTD